MGCQEAVGEKYLKQQDYRRHKNCEVQAFSFRFQCLFKVHTVRRGFLFHLSLDLHTCTDLKGALYMHLCWKKKKITLLLVFQLFSCVEYWFILTAWWKIRCNWHACRRSLDLYHTSFKTELLLQNRLSVQKVYGVEDVDAAPLHAPACTQSSGHL